MISAIGVLSCPWQQGLGATTDIVKIGGRTYSVDQLIDRVLIASAPVKVYRAGSWQTPYYTVPAGQSVGKVYSYIRPSATNGGKFYFQFDHPTEKWPNGTPKSYYAASENIDTSVLNQQGVMTVQQQTDLQKEQDEKQNDPVVYYFKKLGLPLAFGAGAIYLIATFGKTFLQSKLSSKPALSGPGGGKLWWMAGGAIALIGGTIYFIRAKQATKEFVDYVQTGKATPAVEQMIAQAQSQVQKELPSTPILKVAPPPAVISPAQPYYARPVDRAYREEMVQQDVALPSTPVLTVAPPPAVISPARAYYARPVD